MTHHEENIKHLQERKRPSLTSNPKKITLIISIILITSALYEIKPAFSSTIYVPTQFTKIQDAINNATAGDTIQVASGIYYENLLVTKPLTIIGENPHTTIIDGSSNGIVIDIESSNVNINGFTIRNAGSQNNTIASERDVLTQADDYNTITNNIISGGQYGVYASYSHHNTIHNNTFINNPFANIYIANAGYTQVTDNTITESAYGIKTSAATYTNITDNTITQTSYGIYLSLASTGCNIQRNTVTGQTVGIYSSSDNTNIDHNTVTTGSSGIYFYNAKNGFITYNTVTGTSYGIRILMPSPPTVSANNIRNNKVTNSDWAIETQNTQGNTFKANWLENNTYGMYLSASGSNTLYHNNFINNSMQAYSTNDNLWSLSSQGNHWSDYDGVDANNNGIGDTLYRIRPLGNDNYPLMTTWSEHDIAIQNVTTSTNQATPGATININVTVRNNANISTSETFTVTTKYNSTIINTITITPPLTTGATRIVTFNWNTTGTPTGNYTITAEASTVTNELNTHNNNYTDSTIEITSPLAGDLNFDGTVNAADLTILVQAYGSTPGSPNWNPYADLNEDNTINALDMYLLSKDYGQTN